MHRVWLIIALAALGGCATVYEDRYVYYPESGDGGDYYYDRAPVGNVGVGVGYGYSAYDSVFWGLHHSYLDPFWYPGFYYGVTYFPSYYGWSSWYAGDYWRWRNFHPYSPYYGSYWDHYYGWNPGHHHRHGGFRSGNGDPQRYGSARNAAERMAMSTRNEGRASRRSAWIGDAGFPQRGQSYGRSMDRSRGIATRGDGGWTSERLPSGSYAPGARQQGGATGMRSDERFLRHRAGDERMQGTGFSDRGGVSAAGRQPSVRSDFRAPMSSRSGASDRGMLPGFQRGMSPPPRREFRQSAPTRSFESRPSMGDRGGSSMRSSGGASRSSSGRGGSRGRSER